HPGQAEACGHPGRRGPGRLHATDSAGNKAIAARLAVDRGVVIELDAVPALQTRRRVDLGGWIHEGRPGCVGVLTCHTTDGEGVAAVRGEVDLCGLVREAKEVD